jgi:hypothetical protein
VSSQGGVIVKLDEVFSTVSADEYMIGSRPSFFTERDEDFIVIYDRKMCEEHGMNIMKRAYKILPGGDLEEIPVEKMLKEVKSALKDRVDVEEILDQALRSGGPHTLMRTYDILQKHPEVKKQIVSKPGCLFLNIPNPEPGEHDEAIYLRF